MAQILWFENYQSADAPELGGKNASLGTLLGAGLPVPPGFAVPPRAALAFLTAVPPLAPFPAAPA